jgi:hypothetical protein
MSPSQQRVFKLIAKSLLGLLSLQLGMALTAYIYVFVAPELGHRLTVAIGIAFLVGWFAVVIRWMGRQWDEWYDR